MSGWKQTFTAEGKPYYYNSEGETRWEKPDGFSQPTTPATPAAPQPDGAGVWSEAHADNGRPYYYNTVTKETRWEAPPGFVRPLPVARPAPAFVAGGAQNFDDDNNNSNNYRPRERRRDDRDHGLPQKLGGGTPWEHRQDNMGFRGAMPIKSDEPEYSTYEQAEEAFFKMLNKHNISPDATWESALRDIVRDREYRALKDPKERTAAFEKYCVEKRAQEKEKEKERRNKLREDFRKMLSTHEDILHYTRWKTARPIIEREAVFREAGNDDERRRLFDEYIFELKKKHAEENMAQRQSALQDLDALLQALVADPNTKWDQARESVTNNERFVTDPKFKTLNNVDVLTAFDSHVKSLDRIANDAKQRDKRLHTRRVRQARDSFKQLLQQMHSQGKIKAGTRWHDFHPLIAEDERYLNLIGTPGSSALDLFWDVVEEEERKIRSLRNHALDVLEDRRYEMTSDTTHAEFAAIMRRDPRTDQMSGDETSYIFDKLMDKIRKRAEEDRFANERHQRKAIDALRSVIKHLDPPVRINDTYEDVAPRLQGFEEFKVLEDDAARRNAFEKHLRRLRDKEEDAERDRARRDRDRDHRRTESRRDAERDRERRHRTRTPEIDAYEADRRKAMADREKQYRKTSFGLSPPPRDRRDERDDRYRRHEREGLSGYERERREREMERERSYTSRADPRDKGRTLDYGDDDVVGSRPGSVRKRRESDGSGSGRRDVKVRFVKSLFAFADFAC